MIADVVKRLVENSHVLEAHRYTAAADVMREAADEITRLRTSTSQTERRSPGRSWVNPMIATALRRASDTARITDRECSAALAITELLTPVVFNVLDDGLVLRCEDGLDVYIEETDRC